MDLAQNVSLAAADFEREAEIFSRHLGRQDSDGGLLPLAQREIPGFWEKVAEWFRDFFPHIDYPTPSAGFMRALGQFFSFVAQHWILLVTLLLVSLLLGVLYMAVRHYRGQRAEGSTTTLIHEKPLSDLEGELAETVGRREYQRAAQIRWRIFLMRLGQVASVTPLEYTRRETQAPGRVMEKELSWIYALMFAERPLSEFAHNYSQLNRLLEITERGALGGAAAT